MDAGGSVDADVFDISALAASLGQNSFNSGAFDLVQVGDDALLIPYDEAYVTLANVDTQALIGSHSLIFD